MCHHNVSCIKPPLRSTTMKCNIVGMTMVLHYQLDKLHVSLYLFCREQSRTLALNLYILPSPFTMTLSPRARAKLPNPAHDWDLMLAKPPLRSVLTLPVGKRRRTIAQLPGHFTINSTHWKLRRNVTARWPHKILQQHQAFDAKACG